MYRACKTFHTKIKILMNMHTCMDIFQCMMHLVYEELMVLLCQVIINLNHLISTCNQADLPPTTVPPWLPPTHS
jgi:hypothetical protein